MSPFESLEHHNLISIRRSIGTWATQRRQDKAVYGRDSGKED